MPQGPIAVSSVANPRLKSSLNLSDDAVLKATPGTILTILVLEPGSAPGAVHDCATVAAAADANKIAPIPNESGPLALNFPALVGIVVLPGTDQVLAVSYQ